MVEIISIRSRMLTLCIHGYHLVFWCSEVGLYNAAIAILKNDPQLQGVRCRYRLKSG
jgi:hypothetical protein